MTHEPYYQREQSAAKHQILERYLKAFTPIIGSWANEIVYVDCFAGPWNSKASDLSDTSFHRALTVLRGVKAQGRCKRIRALLIENNPARFRQLKEYAAGIPDIDVAAMQWNFEVSVDRIVAYIRDTPTPANRVFPFMFIDPWGWEIVAIDRIRPLLLLDPGEVLITFMSSFVDRFISDSSKPFERLLGHAEVRRLRELKGEELEDELVASFASAVRSAGRYNFSCAVPVMDPKRDRFLFHMVFATRNIKGIEEFKEAEKNMIEVMHRLRAKAQQRRAVEAGSSGFLFDPITTYKEERFSRFRTNSIAALSSALEAKLKASGPTFVQDLLNIGLQYSAVLRDDVSDLVFDWWEQRKVIVQGITPRQRSLRPENTVEWATRS
jgi:three-Cys-motif partner protein